MMRKYSIKIAIFMLLALVSGAVPAFFAARIEARELWDGIDQTEYWKLGGEPGEDPHLKTIPTILLEYKSEPLGAESAGGPVPMDEYSINLEGSREGRGRGLGSRVNLAWRMFLRTWLRHLHR